jgi:purine-binding chemotaxis protein CheW
LIVFDLGNEEFGVKIDEVREVVRTGVITPIPDSPEFIKGVANVRGEIVSVIDLKSRFFLPGGKAGESRHIIITEQEKNIFGLMVDEVTEVLRIPQAEIKATPEILTRIHAEYVRGVVTIGERLIILLDLAKVLSEEELVELAQMARKPRAEIEDTGEEGMVKS